MRSLILTFLVLAVAGSAEAAEPKPHAPDQVAFDFKIGSNSYSMKISSEAGKRAVAISCNGIMVAKPRLDRTPQWKVTGAIIGAELSSDDPARCTGNLTLNLITRDFSAPGDRTLLLYQLGVAGDQIVTFGRSGLRQ